MQIDNINVWSKRRVMFLIKKRYSIEFKRSKWAIRNIFEEENNSKEKVEDLAINYIGKR